MSAKQYLLGGIDFIINKQNEPVFIEANSAPGAKLLKGTEQTGPIDALANLVKERVNRPSAAIVVRRKQVDAGNLWKVQQLGEHFPTRQVIFEDQDYRTPSLVDEEGGEFTPNALLFNTLSFAQLYQGEGFMVNPAEAIRITVDKHLSNMVVSNLTDVQVPGNFMVFSGSGARRVADIMPDVGEGLVLKPIFGWGGRGVHVWEQVPQQFPSFREAMILQNRVDLQLKDGRFWDVRCYVVDGRFCGAVSRVSESPVVNVSLGGRFHELESDVVDLVRKPTEQVASAIDRVAVALSRN